MEHWEIVSNGQIVVDKTAEDLWENMCSYFKHCDDNPITVKRTATSGKDVGKKIGVEFKRPYTIEGMCLHCGISRRYLQEIGQSKMVDDEYYIVVERAMYIIRTQNLEYAMVGEFNPIITKALLNIDTGDDAPQPIRVEVVQGSPKLANSETEISETINEEFEIWKRQKGKNP